MSRSCISVGVLRNCKWPSHTPSEPDGCDRSWTVREVGADDIVIRTKWGTNDTEACDSSLWHMAISSSKHKNMIWGEEWS